MKFLNKFATFGSNFIKFHVFLKMNNNLFFMSRALFIVLKLNWIEVIFSKVQKMISYTLRSYNLRILPTFQ